MATDIPFQSSVPVTRHLLEPRLAQSGKMTLHHRRIFHGPETFHPCQGERGDEPQNLRSFCTCFL